MRDFDLQETINLLEDALKEFNEVSYLSNQRKADEIRTRVQCILMRLPDQYLYIKRKDVYFNNAFFESDLPDIIEDLKKRQNDSKKQSNV